MRTIDTSFEPMKHCAKTPTVEWAGVGVEVHGDRWVLVVWPWQDPTARTVEISFCPWCGERLPLLAEGDADG